MPVSAFMPDITAEIAFATGPDDPAPAWVDVSSYVEAHSAIGITRGRSDELSDIQPSRLTVTLDNTDARFTAGNTSSPYYPNVKKNRRIRVSARWPLGQSGNLLTANQSSFETSVADWTPGGSVPPTLTQSASNAFDGTKSMLVTWGTGGTFPQATTVLTGLVIGRTYTASAYVFVPAGTSPFAQLVIGGVTTGTANTTRGVQQRISVTFTATATTHDLHVWPDTAATAGDTVYVDGVMVDEGSTVGTFTLSPPPISRRFTGYVDEWPVNWPSGTDEYASTTITASSRRARLAAGSELRSIIEEEYLLDSPTAYYPMGEPTPVGPGQAGDVSVNQQPNLVAAGTGPAIQWQAATGPGTDALSAPVFNDGRYLLLDGVDLVDDTAHEWLTLEAFVNTTDSGTQRGAVSMFGPDLWYVYIGVDIAGHAVGVGGTIGSAPSFDLASTATINDGETHHLALRIDHDAPTAVALFVDGVEVDSGGAVASQINRITVGNFKPADPDLPQSGGWVGSVSHVAVTSSATELTSARIAVHAESGLTGFEGESSDQRIERLARLAGIDPSEVSTEPGLTTSMAAQETTGKTPLDQMEQAADTEGGILFDATDGTLTFHSRDHRYSAAVAFTLDAGLQQIEASLEAKLDGQQLVNDVTASRIGGDSAIRVLNPDSITEHGVRRETLELYTTSDNELLDAVNWKVNQYGEPNVRVNAVTVDVINSPTSLVTSLLDAELGDKITLANLPDQAPDTSMDGFVEGITETIGPESYTISLELSPAAIFDVWELDSATRSQLDQTTVLAY